MDKGHKTLKLLQLGVLFSSTVYEQHKYIVIVLPVS